MIANISLVLSLIVAIIGMVRFKKLTMPFKLLAILQVLDLFLTNIASKQVESLYHNNALISHVQALNSYIFYSLIYYLLFRNKYLKKFILVTVVIITIFCFINAIFLEPYAKSFPIYTIIPTDILYIAFSMLLFRQMLLYPMATNLIKQSIFWYNTGLLFFSTTMFMNLGLMNYYSHHRPHDQLIFYFWYTDIIIFNVLIGMAILTDRKEAATINA
jgi:hypothetical protein